MLKQNEHHRLLFLDFTSLFRITCDRVGRDTLVHFNVPNDGVIELVKVREYLLLNGF